MVVPSRVRLTGHLFKQINDHQQELDMFLEANRPYLISRDFPAYHLVSIIVR